MILIMDVHVGHSPYTDTAIHRDKTGAINHLIRHIQESKYKVLESPAEKFLREL
jgi:hypothetical protein